MKAILITLFIAVIFCGAGHAQTGQSEIIANRIAQKMKDTLSLTPGQKELLYNINMQLANEKKLVWAQYPGNDSLITIHIQRVEKSRDSLYRPVLTAEQFNLYTVKKRSLVNNN